MQSVVLAPAVRLQGLPGHYFGDPIDSNRRLYIERLEAGAQGLHRAVGHQRRVSRVRCLARPYGSLFDSRGRRDSTTACRRDHLVVNDAEAVAHYLAAGQAEQRARPTCVDCLLDNAGLELLGDLCLTDYLLSTDRVQIVRLHAKLHPTFVSDATVADVQATVVWLRHHTDTAWRTLGARLHAWLRNRRLQLQTHPFWTSPLPLWDMPEDLRHRLAAATLVIAKGDAHYRRALGDAHWPFTTPLADVVSYLPAPVVFLRTCKAEVIAGLSTAQVAELRQRDPDWLTNGRWGIMQFVPGHS